MKPVDTGNWFPWLLYSTSYRTSALANGSPLRRAYVIRSRTSRRVRGRYPARHNSSCGSRPPRAAGRTVSATPRCPGAGAERRPTPRGSVAPRSGGRSGAACHGCRAACTRPGRADRRTRSSREPYRQVRRDRGEARQDFRARGSDVPLLRGEQPDERGPRVTRILDRPSSDHLTERNVRRPAAVVHVIGRAGSTSASMTVAYATGAAAATSGDRLPLGHALVFVPTPPHPTPPPTERQRPTPLPVSLTGPGLRRETRPGRPSAPLR